MESVKGVLRAPEAGAALCQGSDKPLFQIFLEPDGEHISRGYADGFQNVLVSPSKNQKISGFLISVKEAIPASPYLEPITERGGRI